MSAGCSAKAVVGEQAGREALPGDIGVFVDVGAGPECPLAHIEPHFPGSCSLRLSVALQGSERPIQVFVSLTLPGFYPKVELSLVQSQVLNIRKSLETDL